jgi:microcystin-dependent protein
MKITFLPESVAPTGETVIPIVHAGQTKKLPLSAFSSFAQGGTIATLFPGENVKFSQTPATTETSVQFFFPGSLYPYPSNDIPQGWLLCYGQAVSRFAYRDLFDVIGVTYGSGDNRTTFNLPDLRGRVLAGMDTSPNTGKANRLLYQRQGNVNGDVLGSTGGEQSHVLTMAESGVPPHQHSFTTNVGWSYNAENGENCYGGNSRPRGMFQGGSDLDFSYSLTISNQSVPFADPHPNVPPLAFLNWVIKY